MKQSKYTIRKDPRVDAFVEGQLSQVADGVRELMGDDLVALLLGGGFGRGEGGVKIGPDGDIRVVNDYDFEVVYRERFGTVLSKLLVHLGKGKALEALAEELAASLRVKQVDLSLRGESSFVGITTPRLCDFDLKNGHVVLLGDENPTDRMPEFVPGDIPKFEGVWLLRNRGIGLLLARFYLDGKGEVIPEKREYFNIEVNKAVLAMGDALFLEAGTYHPLYDRRRELIRSVVPEDAWWAEDLISLYALSAEFKLCPSPDFAFPEPPDKMWRKVALMMRSVFLHFESTRLGRDLKGLEDYATFLRERPRNSLKIRARLTVDRLLGRIESDIPGLAYLKRDKSANILFAMLLISLASDEATAAEHSLLLQELGADVGPEGVGDESWYKYARELLLLSHPQGELGRMLKEQR